MLTNGKSNVASESQYKWWKLYIPQRMESLASVYPRFIRSAGSNPTMDTDTHASFSPQECLNAPTYTVIYFPLVLIIMHPDLSSFWPIGSAFGFSRDA